MLASDLTHIVLDTNILVGMLNHDKDCKLILNHLKHRSFILEANSEILKEYSEVLNTLVKRGKLSGDSVSELMKMIRAWVKVGRLFVSPTIVIPADPSDEKFFISGNCLAADYLITTNTKHFDPIKEDIKRLNLKLKIITPAELPALKRVT